MANYGILPQQYNGTTYDTLYFKNSLNGTTAPTTSTVAYYVGQLYINTTNGDIFKCTAISAPTYTWKPITNQSVVVDYVVEEGTSGIWSYKKWNSGIAECWGQWSGSLTHYSTTLGGYLFANTMNLPFTFSEAPTYTYVGKVGSGAGIPSSLFSSTTQVQFVLLSSLSGSQSVTANLIVNGRWK